MILPAGFFFSQFWFISYFLLGDFKTLASGPIFSSYMANLVLYSLFFVMIRCKLEQHSRRRVERAMRQYDVLVNGASTENSSPHISARIGLFYSCKVPKIWSLQRDLAGLLLSLGLTGEALDVFQKLEMWEDVIACYQRMGKVEKVIFFFSFEIDDSTLAY